MAGFVVARYADCVFFLPGFGQACVKTYTYSPTTAPESRKWFLIDAEDLIPGRLAALIANRLRGKHKAFYTPHADCGDSVVVVNASKVYLTGKKHTDKIYYRHTGYPGGIRSQTAGAILEGRFPERLLQKAVERMIPRGPLGRSQLRHLYIYAGPEHRHSAQNPEKLDIAAMNNKNRRRS